MNFSKLRWIVLSLLFMFAIATSLVAAWISDDWTGLVLNLGTELAGAIVTYVILELVLERLESNITRKNDLILRLRSKVDDAVVLAKEDLYSTNWLFDGSLKGADLSGIKLPGAKLRKANLKGANLSKADLSKADLGEADLREAKLTEANLRGADLSGGRTKMLHLGRIRDRDLILAFAPHVTLLGQADLSKVNLSVANLRGVNLTEANMCEAILRGADLRKSILVASNLKNADLHEANLENAIYNEGTIWPDDFDPKKAGAVKLKSVLKRFFEQNNRNFFDDALERRNY